MGEAEGELGRDSSIVGEGVSDVGLVGFGLHLRSFCVTDLCHRTLAGSQKAFSHELDFHSLYCFRRLINA